MIKKVVRAGFIGCGKHSTRSLYPNFAKIPNLKLIATCDLKKGLARRNAQFFGAQNSYVDFEKMLSKEDLDAVFIVGPPRIHAEIGRICLEEGFHIFVEKPPAKDLEEAKKLVDTARKTRKLAQVGHMMRHAPTIRKAIDIMHIADFGTPIFLESKYFTPGPGIQDQETLPGWTYMIIQATHPIDLAHHFLGDISKLSAVRCVGFNQMPVFSVALKFKCGAAGFLNLNGAAPHWTSRLEIVGDKFTQITVTDLGKLSYEHNIEGGYEFPVGRPSQNWDVPLRDDSEKRAGYFGEIAYFAQSILNNNPVYPSVEDGYKAMVICRAILESVKKEKVVTIHYQI
jgi:predicted dehydrogenase